MTEIRRVLIWSGWLRLSHWTLALSVLVLIATGWAISNGPMVAADALEYHYLAASVMIFALVLRVLVFIRGKPHERLAALFPELSEFNAIKQTFIFYLSLAKQPLPNWYAHNPFWKMLYVFMYVGLLLLLISGTVMVDHPVVFGFYLPSVHASWSTVLTILVLLHLLSTFVHDYYAKTTDISAMVNGYRLFELEGTGKSRPDLKTVSVELQSMKSLLGKNNNDRDNQ